MNRFLGAVVLTEFLAVYLVTKAITMGNATYVSLIEISYPIFVILFGYLFFKVNHFNMPVIIGTLLVMLGIGIIVWNDSGETSVLPESSAVACAVKECDKAAGKFE